MTIEVIYRIDRPFAPGVVEAYGEPDMGWYEWRIIEGDRDEIRKGGGKVLADSGKHGSYGQQYGSPALALRDGLNHDEPPEPRAPAVVPISWVPGRDAGSENLTQVWRSQETLRDMATELVKEVANAKIQRRVMNPDHPNGRLGMIYTDERTATTEHIAQVLNDAADKLLIFAHHITEQAPKDPQ